MSNYTAENLQLVPYFDMEALMALSQEKRLGGEVVERLAQRWEQWVPLLHAQKLDVGKIQYLAVWLDKQVEDDVDSLWEQSPSDGFLYNALAQLLCMSSVHQVLPEIEDAGCAPAPRPTESLRAALQAQGLPYKEGGDTLALRYAVVTHYPFKGSCEICHLQAQCPKGQGKAGAASVVLPGYEQ